MTEGPPKDSFEISRDLFKEDHIDDVRDFLEKGTVKAEAFFKLAQTVAQNRQELFGTYHNLFSSEKEKSLQYITGLADKYQKYLEGDTIEEWQKEGVQKNIQTAQAWIDFMNEHPESGWHLTWNVKSVLEECLKK